uniref:Tigger transposable element-derived protein 6 n=1 Tax=Sipha flava TaxID=143950 RepID=A0A2S2Q5U0_9HEMI
MTQIIFNDWLIDFDREMKKKKRKILLLIDNCIPHNEPPKLDYIRLEYFPPNCTAVHQPLDQGIIRAVKSRYRIFLLRQIVCDFEKNIQRKCNVKKAIKWIFGTWDNMSINNTNCWKHATPIEEAASVSKVVEYVSNTHDIQHSELEQIWITAKKKRRFLTK